MIKPNSLPLLNLRSISNQVPIGAGGGHLLQMPTEQNETLRKFEQAQIKEQIDNDAEMAAGLQNYRTPRLQPIGAGRGVGIGLPRMPTEQNETLRKFEQAQIKEQIDNDAEMAAGLQNYRTPRLQPIRAGGGSGIGLPQPISSIQLTSKPIGVGGGGGIDLPPIQMATAESLAYIPKITTDMIPPTTLTIKASLPLPNGGFTKNLLPDLIIQKNDNPPTTKNFRDLIFELRGIHDNTRFTITLNDKTIKLIANNNSIILTYNNDNTKIILNSTILNVNNTNCMIIIIHLLKSQLGGTSKRNKSKRNKSKRNKSKRNKSKRNKSTRNKSKRNKSKRNKSSSV